MLKSKQSKKTKSSRFRVIRDASINLRVQPQQRDLIDRAVAVLGKSRSDFMLEVACNEAQNVLLDRRYFALEPEAFDRFLAALDEAPTDNERLRRTLTSPVPWE
ncbi:MAG: DUF1778 domain-containing protein [Nitrospinota bacterium]|nr:DUF1778 domain-containing protein [Nitrospinota bacterium]